MLTDDELFDAYSVGHDQINGFRAVERAVLLKAADELAEKFRSMRFDASFHLGLGDIRLSIGAQDEIVAMIREQAGGEQ